MDNTIESISEIGIRICLDLRPSSIIDKKKFNELYEKLDELKTKINITNPPLIPKELIKMLLYINDGIIVQCNFSEKKDHLINEWIILNSHLSRIFNVPNDETVEVDIEQELDAHTNHVKPYTVGIIFKQLHQLIYNSDLILAPSKYKEVGSLYDTKNENLMAYWKLLSIIESKLN
ncbi:hypothetical protein [Paenibacillus mucilaginosus]|uniref:Uncharacterized protein n=1 Tax=Paenibacillus mucilaginosus (strain KNP414) TaxID=1036673 RepID=F8FED2_PAEMK|nr:hypothetical protein [Paenibacillus mucilaginosus]AEI44531.1 hypothetical protein KNP414_06007 [Paenibacillus mucilaginosus KNP414]MCG7217475.1 hypothetical protein [Paenibacillus mucilaginosus]WDM30876.1 hypothetical protein KCX80_17705 [Paenibacillus mucilaginosus]